MTGTGNAPAVVGNVTDLIGVGLTYRQADWWTVRGYLKATANGEGPGHRRHWPAGEVAVAALMIRLIDGGIQVETAHLAARAGGLLERNGIRIQVMA